MRNVSNLSVIKAHFAVYLPYSLLFALIVERIERQVEDTTYNRVNVPISDPLYFPTSSISTSYSGQEDSSSSKRDHEEERDIDIVSSYE